MHVYAGVVPKPKSSCCDDRPRCKRCPIRLLAEGRLSPQDARKIFAKGRNRKVAKKAKIQVPEAA